jgi:hypothetical protein
MAPQIRANPCGCPLAREIWLQETDFLKGRIDAAGKRRSF